MSIRVIVQHVLRTGWLKLSEENALLNAVRGRPKFSSAELKALVDLQKALQAGHVTVGVRKKCVNVMEKLVQEAIVEEISRRGLADEDLPDVGDVAGYALNRLPPLYATTQEGFEHQVNKAREHSRDDIQQKVREGIDRSLDRPNFPPGREPLGLISGADTIYEIVTQLSPDAPDSE